MKLKSRVFRQYHGKVYDLTVANSHSYNVEGLGVHNSAGGSLLCYLLGITDIDPVEHKLMFERFINVDRIETPDVDLDFENVDEVKDIMRKMYGDDNVACISTYGTNQIKGIIKDVCRVYSIDHEEANRANAKIDKEIQAIYGESADAKSATAIKLDDVYRLSKTFREFISLHPEIEKPIQRLYGRAHHVGRHASGVVIGDNLPAETAVFYSKGILQTSFTDGIVNKNLSSMGLVKFDILGLATLSIIKKAIQLIANKRNASFEEVYAEIDPKKMDFNDIKVMKTVFWENNMSGVFQCFDENSLVTMFDGTKKKICDILIGDRVISRNENGTYSPHFVENVIDNGYKDCIELVFKNNKKVICTPDHRFYTKNRGWVEAQYLNEDDDVEDLPVKKLFNAICTACNKQYKTYIQREQVKRFHFECKSCAIKKMWNNEEYRKVHEVSLKEAANRPERILKMKLSWSKLTKEQKKQRCKNWSKAAHTPEALEKLSNSLKKFYRNNEPIRKTKKYIQETVFDVYGKKRVLSSSWEKRFVNILQRENVKWTYEEHRFQLKSLENRTYTPDFFCPDKNIFFEVKGYLWPDAKIKLNAFYLEYPSVKLVIIDGEKLQKLEQGASLETFF